MKIGLSTYAFFWQWSELANKKLSLKEMMNETKKYGGDVFQICDYPAIEEMNDEELADIASYARSLGLELELGTRGIHPAILKRYLALAKKLNVPMLRSMYFSKDFTPANLDQAVQWIEEVLEDFQQAGVTLGLETYEQIKTDQLVDLIKRIDQPYVGICLDPANTVASLELPKDVIDKTASYVVNLHVKDFAFTRNQGWVGFYYSGAPLGKGLLDFNYMYRTVLNKSKKEFNTIIELWVNFEETIEKTIQVEKEWIETSMDYVRRNR
ncbi:sugar phosphate isomerase/epimerase family protein [Alkalihalobacillus sp. R86527]|uniref:sugar phosphate isomerase/epimerase family protein n=1 Tax=Alkalihalobacillus sp. R86527 TaxID=3093863 RepID=UPI0036717323